MDEPVRSQEYWKHGGLTARILACALRVSNELGAGFLESVYHNAMLVALSNAELPTETQKPLAVSFMGQLVGRYFADLVVDAKVIVELKAVRTLAPEHSAQVLNYLRASGIEVGLLINFGSPRMQYRRLIVSRDIGPIPPAETIPASGQQTQPDESLTGRTDGAIFSTGGR
jgi:GxxExxY protein